MTQKCISSLGIRKDRGACPRAHVSTLALLLSAFVASGAATPEGPWDRTTAEEQGLAGGRLESLRADLATRKTRAFLVIRNDAIVCEWYAPGQGARTQFGTASLAKAIVGGLSLAAAMTDGHLELDDPAAKYISQWRDDPRKSKITLRQLGSHTSGIEDAEANGTPHDQLAGWKGDFWKRLAVPNDPFTVARDRAPLVFEPGEKMQYSNPGIGLMTWCVTASLRDAVQKDIRSLLRDRIMRPIGVSDEEWSVGYGQTFQVGGLPLVPSWGGGNYTARAAAMVGRLMLRGGDWDGRRLLSAEAVRLTTFDAGTPGPCGIGWWSNHERDCAKLPQDAFFGSGAGHQILLVVPSLNLIVVRFGGLLANVATDPKSYHEAYNQYLFEPLMSAFSTPAPETNRFESDTANIKSEPGWRPLPLIKDGRIDTNWTQVGWGGFVVDDGALRTECHPKGLGLLFYGKEKFGNCQIRVVFKSKEAKANAGVFVRIPDGIREQVGQPGTAFDRGADGKISSVSMKKMMDSAEREEGPWFAVHRGYEIQIMDANDKWHRTGAVYSLAASSAVSGKPPGEWRTMVITLQGDLILVDVDGQRVTNFDPKSADVPGDRKWFEPKREPKRPEAGYLGLQNHDPGDVVWFREISVRPVPDSNSK